MNRKNLIVIGTSAGGLEALITLLTPLKKDLPAAILIVQHVSPTSLIEVLVSTLQKHTSLHCKSGEDGDLLQDGCVYLAPTDQHMLVVDGHIWLTKGPRENGFRPAIDTLFRSAAAYYGQYTIGVILTGLLYDGTVGMEAIRRSGGLTLVQDPADAAYQDMPRNVLHHMEVDYVVPAAEIGVLLEELVHRYRPDREQGAPDDIKAEAAIVERVMTATENVESLGHRSVFVCPDCGGSLWQMKQEGVARYRCYAGHAYVAETLLENKDQQLEETLWIVMRILEERKNMLTVLASQSQQNADVKNMYEDKIREADSHIARIKSIIMTDSRAHEVLSKKAEN